MVTQELTPEWAEHATEGQITIYDMKQAVKRFERSYNAVAQVTEEEDKFGSRYKIRAIAAQDAELDEIKRGLQTIMHWIMEYKKEKSDEAN